MDGVATCEGNTNVARAVTVEVPEAGDSEVATVEHVDRLTCFGLLDEVWVVFDGEGNVFDYGFKQHVWTPSWHVWLPVMGYRKSGYFNYGTL